MKIQFLNSIPLEMISGGNIYNQKIINGLRENDFKLDYNQKSQNIDYDVTIVDSLFMPEFPLEMTHSSLIIALIHQIPNLEKDSIDFFKTNAKFVVTSHFVKKELMQKWHLNKAKVHVIRPGIDENWFPKKSFSHQPKNILFVANFVKGKGYEMLCEVMKNSEQKFTFHIVGNPDLDKAFAAQIIQKLKETNQKIAFHFNLNRNEIYEQFLKADVLLSCSESETFGMAIFEGLSLGLPCIAYKTGDYEFFSKFQNYYGIDNYKVSEFIHILNDWREKPQVYQSYCTTNVETTRNWQNAVNELYNLIQNKVLC